MQKQGGSGGSTLIIKYMDFRALLGGFMPLERLKSEQGGYKLRAEPRDLERITKYLNHRAFKGEIEARDIRLYIPARTGFGEYIVDRQGRVQRHGEQYYMSPLNFLELNDYLDYLKVRNGIREGLPRYNGR